MFPASFEFLQGTNTSAPNCRFLRHTYRNTPFTYAQNSLNFLNLKQDRSEIPTTQSQKLPADRNACIHQRAAVQAECPLRRVVRFDPVHEQDDRRQIGLQRCIIFHLIQLVRIQALQAQALPRAIHFVQALVESRDRAPLVAGDHHPCRLVSFEKDCGAGRSRRPPE